MKKIIMAGTVEFLIGIMKCDDHKLVEVIHLKEIDEYIYRFTFDYAGCYTYITDVQLQVNEFNEDNTPVAINVVKVNTYIK